MRRTALALAMLLALAAPAAAQVLVETYQAELGPQDHFASDGVPLRTAAGIIRQDRANYHRFNRRDPFDGPDRTFADVNMRAALEQMILRGGLAPAVEAAIINGQPRIEVEIWRDQNVYYIKVRIIF
jgi:hypothetical protein